MLVDSLEKVHNDAELQSWGRELSKAKEDGGAGLKVTTVTAAAATTTRLLIGCLLYTSPSPRDS